jgi:hypothetical protein
MNEIDEGRRRRFAREMVAYKEALDKAKATLEIKAADGDGPLLDVRDQWIATLERNIANREHLISAIDRDNG